MFKSVLWDFHTNFLSRTQPWPREPPKHSHLRKFKVSTFHNKGVHEKWPDIAPIGLSLKLPHKVGCDSKESGHQKVQGGPFVGETWKIGLKKDILSTKI